MTSSPRSKEKPLGRIALESVTARFGERSALEDVTIEVEPGERLAVIGASGAGKTTLFRVLTRSVALSSGRVTIGERELYALSKKDLKGVRRRVGTIYQAYNLVPQLPAGVNVALGEVGCMGSLKTLRTFLSGPDGALAKSIEETLDRVGLAGRARTRTADLSGGQQQRVAVARLLVQRPDLILADEPFAAVDPVTTERVMDTLFELNDEGATLLVNLHDVSIARRFPRIIALREGRPVFDGSPDLLTEEQLSRIYAGDPYGTAAEPDPETQNGVRRHVEGSVRLVEGRDGVSAH
ncbi:phosphonate ABC transporter ATP-binding protein [soil metagenome]